MGAASSTGKYLSAEKETRLVSTVLFFFFSSYPFSQFTLSGEGVQMGTSQLNTYGCVCTSVPASSVHCCDAGKVFLTIMVPSKLKMYLF